MKRKIFVLTMFTTIIIATVACNTQKSAWTKYDENETDILSEEEKLLLEEHTFEELFRDVTLSRLVARKLDKSPNRITTLQELQSIDILEVEDDSPMIQSFDVIEHLQKLHRLVIRTNNLTELFEKVQDLPSLRWLGITNSNLTEILESIGNCKKLNFLNLDNNLL